MGHIKYLKILHLRFFSKSNSEPFTSHWGHLQQECQFLLYIHVFRKGNPWSNVLSPGLVSVNSAGHGEYTAGVGGVGKGSSSWRKGKWENPDGASQ